MHPYFSSRFNFLPPLTPGPQPASLPAPAPATAGPGPNSRAIRPSPDLLPPPAPDQVLDDLPVAQCEDMQDSAPARCRHGSRGRKVRESPLSAPPLCTAFPAFHHQPLPSSLSPPPNLQTAPRSRAATGQPHPPPSPIAGPPGLCPAQQVWHVLSPEGLYEHHQGAGS